MQKGTLPEQKVLVADVGSVLEATARHPIETPALVVVGNMVKFSKLEEFLPLLEESAVGERTW